MSDLTIKVKVIKAILTHDTEIGSEMDPFVVLKMGTVQKRGKTFDEAGDMPVFNEQFQFLYQGHLTMFHLIVYDEDTTIDDLVGEVQIDLKPIISQQFTPKKWYSLKYDGTKPAGKIMLEFQCKKDEISVSQNHKIIKQLIKPNIHYIGGLKPSSIKQIHHLNSKHHNKQIKSHKRIFSFRDFAVHQEKNQKNLPNLNYSSNTHLSNYTLPSQNYFPSEQSYPNQNKYYENSSLTNIYNATSIKNIPTYCLVENKNPQTININFNAFSQKAISISNSNRTLH